MKGIDNQDIACPRSGTISMNYQKKMIQSSPEFEVVKADAVLDAQCIASLRQPDFACLLANHEEADTRLILQYQETNEQLFKDSNLMF